jgi:cation transport regulator ChaC
MPGYAKKANRSNKRRTPPTVVPSNREYYFGANATRGSIAQNPGAWSSPKQKEFGLPTFGRISRMPSEQVLDAQAEREMNKGYTKRRNQVCTNCFVQKSNTGVCGCE